LAGGRLRIAVPTCGDRGLEDTVAEVFGRAKTFTMVDVDSGRVEAVRVLVNPAASYRQGAGPIAVKMLMDHGANIVAAGDVGPGVLSLLEQHGVPMLTVKPGTRVAEVVRLARDHAI